MCFLLPFSLSSSVNENESSPQSSVCVCVRKILFSKSTPNPITEERAEQTQKELFIAPKNLYHNEIFHESCTERSDECFSLCSTRFFWFFGAVKTLLRAREREKAEKPLRPSIWLIKNFVKILICDGNSSASLSLQTHSSLNWRNYRVWFAVWCDLRLCNQQQ